MGYTKEYAIDCVATYKKLQSLSEEIMNKLAVLYRLDDWDLRSVDIDEDNLQGEFTRYRFGDKQEEYITVPLDYLWDNDYISKEEEKIEERQRKAEQYLKQKAARDMENRQQKERAEYERLKAKFEGS